MDVAYANIGLHDAGIYVRRFLGESYDYKIYAQQKMCVCIDITI